MDIYKLQYEIKEKMKTHRDRLFSFQESVDILNERQKNTPGLELHAKGLCPHVGKLSPGCSSCFGYDSTKINIVPTQILNIPRICNSNCAYCPDEKNAKSELQSDIISDSSVKKLQEAVQKWACYVNVKDIKEPNNIIPGVSFSGDGEPSLYPELISRLKELHKKTIIDKVGKPFWCHMYTNGLLMDEDLAKRFRDIGIDEMRFHLGASHFSEKVYNNLKTAVRIFQTVSVETPSWPPHRIKLFEMLPRIEDIGVQHLNMGQIQVFPNNINAILSEYPEATFFPIGTYGWHLNDEGLVYDIIKEVLEKKYSYSVLDCGVHAKNAQCSGYMGRTTKIIMPLIDEKEYAEMVDTDAYKLKCEKENKNMNRSQMRAK